MLTSLFYGIFLILAFFLQFLSPKRTVSTMVTPNNHPYTVISDHLDQPVIDDRKYQLIQLPNKMVALLIHDPETDKSAAALDVNAGAFHDPKNLPGLAHFCEHLLFMGTKKYPSENEYSSYLSSHSGFSNAYTSSLHTNFYFEVANEALKGALDRFAQFFICPLFSSSGKDREINAVDSENKKNLENDSWRLYQLSKSLTNEKHPFNGFSTGNKSTLGEIPAKNDIDVRQELLKYHSSKYSANLMRLVVLSNEPLETLTNWAVDMFSPAVNKDLRRPIYKSSPFKNCQFDGSIIVKAKPIREMRALELTFPVPDTDPYWKYIPSRYLSHLLGHESKGSLLYNFKEKKWATGLSAGAMTLSSGFAEFEIDVDLTKEGISHVDDIIKDVFKYVKMLQMNGPKEWIYKEIKDQSEFNFKFRQKYGASSTVSKLASNLHSLNFYKTGLSDPKEDISENGNLETGIIPPEHFLSLSVVREYDPDLISKYTSYLNPSNFKVLLVAKESFEDQKMEICKERWYGTNYRIDKLSSSLVNEVKEIYYEGEHLDPVYTLPPKNKFIPTNFNLASGDEMDFKYPKLVDADKKNKIWYRFDTKLGGPRSALKFKFNIPGATSTPLKSVLPSLFLDVLDDDLNSISYLASISGLSHEFEIARDGISLEIGGFSDKLEILLETLVDRLVKFSDPSLEDIMWNETRRARFHVLREKLLKNLKNFGYTVPYNQVGPMISSLINENSWLVDDQLEIYFAVTFENLRSYVSSLFSTCFVETLVVGNYDKKSAKDLSRMVSSKLQKSVSLSRSQYTRGRSLNLPDGKAFHYLKENDDPENVNSCIEVYIQLGMISDAPNRVMAELIAQILHEPFFDRLRTKEQLGYVVFSGIRETRTTFGLRFLIQSERPTGYLYMRIKQFIAKESRKLALLSEEDFKKHVNALIVKKLQKVKNISEERSRFWNRIASGFYDFERREEDSNLLRTIPLKAVQEYFEDKIVNLDHHGELIVHLQGHATANNATSYQNLVSNFIYQKPELDDVEYDQDALNALVQEVSKKKVDSDDFVDSLINHHTFKSIVPKFSFSSELKRYLRDEIAKNYAKIPYDDQNISIRQVGEWKSGIPLTAAPSAKIMDCYLDKSNALDSKF